MNTQNEFFLEDATVFQVMFEYATVGIILVDVNGKIIEVNPFAQKLFGYEREELIGQGVEMLIPTSLREKHRGHRKGYAQHPVPRAMGAELDLFACRKSGEEFPVEISLGSAHHGDQQFVITYINDISDRKMAEKAVLVHKEQLAKYANQLEDKVQERTNELENAFNQILSANRKLEVEIREKKAAEEALRKNQAKIQRALAKEKELSELKSRFVSMASHEFRTPLSTISSSAELVELYEKQEQQEKRVKHLNRIKASVRNLTSILNDFLSLEKLESGKIRFQPKTIDFPQLVGELIEDISALKKPGQNIQFQHDHQNEIVLDPYLIRNILNNLLSNALKYSPAESQVELITTLSKNHLQIKVVDKGMGIQEEDQQHMFTRFFRAHNVSNIKGTGLGLTIVKHYLDLMEGSIEFVSKEGKGTTFIVKIPGIK